MVGLLAGSRRRCDRRLIGSVGGIGSLHVVETQFYAKLLLDVLIALIYGVADQVTGRLFVIHLVLCVGALKNVDLFCHTVGGEIQTVRQSKRFLRVFGLPSFATAIAAGGRYRTGGRRGLVTASGIFLTAGKDAQNGDKDKYQCNNSFHKNLLLFFRLAFRDSTDILSQKEPLQNPRYRQKSDKILRYLLNTRRENCRCCYVVQFMNSKIMQSAKNYFFVPQAYSFGVMPVRFLKKE